MSRAAAEHVGPLLTRIDRVDVRLVRAFREPARITAQTDPTCRFRRQPHLR